MRLSQRSQWFLSIEVSATHFLLIREGREEEGRGRLARQGEVGQVRWCRRECTQTLCIRKEFRVRNSTYQRKETGLSRR